MSRAGFRRIVLALIAGLAVSPVGTAGASVGHRVEHILVPGPASGEQRQVDVHLWYPADPADALTKPKTVYTSALSGKALPNGWAPLSWSVDAELAREGAAFKPSSVPYAPIVFSHGASNDPIDYAHTLEAIADAG